MRTAETVLSIIRERGQRGLPLERLYRQLYNPNLYLRAYGKLYANNGAMTPGITSETVDGMSLAKIDRIIDALKQERYRWTPEVYNIMCMEFLRCDRIAESSFNYQEEA